MRKALFTLCALGAASLSLAPIAAQAAPADRVTAVSATRSCDSARPDTEAAVLSAAPVDVPSIAREMGFRGTAWIRIDIAPNGTLVAARVAQSSGNALVDAAALSAANASTFRPATVNCTPIGGSYLLVADLDT